jgi:hypothetical protein
MLPGTSVAEVVVCFPYDNRGFEGMLRLLGVLHRLDSLVSLRITGLRPEQRDYPNFDKVIDAINCPQLKRLYLSNSNSSILPCLKDKLPSLEVLWIIDEPWTKTAAWTESYYYITPHGKWRRLECISERRILFLNTRSSHDVVHLLPFVFSYAKRYGPVDPTAIASWLLHSHHNLAETRQLKEYTN